MRMFREAVEIIHTMWTEDRPVFQGKHYQIDGPINEPKGVQKPHIPLWIGGGGEKVTLKLVAKWGDACNVGGGNPDVCRQKLAVLRQHCDEQGRDFGTITTSTNIMLFLLDDGADPERATAAARGAASFEEFSRSYFVATVDQATRRIEELVAAGIDYVIIYLPRLAYDQTQMRRFASEIIPRFA
jgi:alkanesulfonate monooxygenase SsuD/methylene tetrahydromethanopterin reductase-like flavin-dependent oxidoreductase (luciferase family)